MSKIYLDTLKKICLGVLDIKIKREQNDDNETGLKEEEVTETSTTVLSTYAMHTLSFAFVFTYLQRHTK